MSNQTQTPEPSTPGKPKSSGSRQQKHQDQGTQTGSDKLDRDSSRSEGGREPPTPPSTK